MIANVESRAPASSSAERGWSRSSAQSIASEPFQNGVVSMPGSPTTAHSQ